MNWQLKTFDALSNRELYEILRLRNAVFVVEQNCVYLDTDGADLQCLHLFQTSGTGEILAYCRIVPPGIFYPESSIGRVLSNPQERKKGLGKELMEKAIACCLQKYPGRGIQIGAQLYLKNFYTRLGFSAQGGIYLEDGIEHIKMIYTR
jgi:ElaA protein